MRSFRSQVMPKGRLRTEPADVMLVVHDPIQPPAIESPTGRDAKALADRAHAVVPIASDAEGEAAHGAGGCDAGRSRSDSAAGDRVADGARRQGARGPRPCGRSDRK